jgi:Papain-like cysteine protease AvrRpt2
LFCEVKIERKVSAMSDFACPDSGYHYDVPLIPQPDKLSCWAGSMTMLVSYKQNASRTPESLAEEVGRSLRTSYDWDMLEEVKDHFGFQDIPLPSNASLYPSPSQWCEWLGTYGPLWVTTVGAPSHAIVVRGLQGDLTPEGTRIEILNPWDISQSFSSDPIDFEPENNGMSYTSTFQDFAADFGLLGLDDYGNWRVLYLPGTAAAPVNE